MRRGARVRSNGSACRAEFRRFKSDPRLMDNSTNMTKEEVIEDLKRKLEDDPEVYDRMAV